jgi:hypothetical protein
MRQIYNPLGMSDDPSPPDTIKLEVLMLRYLTRIPLSHPHCAEWFDIEDERDRLNLNSGQFELIWDAVALRYKKFVGITR